MAVIEAILNIAKSYEGQEEIRGNKGFKESWFQNLMIRMGWKKHQAWCAYAAEAVWKEAYGIFFNNYMIEELDELFSASAVQTWKNFKKSPRWKTSKIPVNGSLVVWQKYKNGRPHWSGHIGILDTASNSKMKTWDGNTNYGKSREGYVFTSVEREINFYKKNGLRLLGFVHPREIYEEINYKSYKKIKV